jgi:succinoglycan biosynthesis transport protein ExoP
LLLPSGPVPDEPAELLASHGMEQVVAQLREAADIVLIDSAPTLLVADSLELVPLADGVVVVADASSSTRSAVEQLRTQVERIGGTIIGCVQNNLDPSATAYSAYYGSRYGYRERGSKRRTRRQARSDDAAPTRAAVSVGGDADYFDLPSPTNGNGHGVPSPASPGRRSPAT